MKVSAALSWDEVRFFLALGRSRTLGEAGARLGVDASTMSRRLLALEDALSTHLFERGRDGIVPTEAADKLRPAAEEMEYAMARFTGTVESFERDVSGEVRVACPGDVAQILIAPLLPRLFEQRPQLSVDLFADEGVVDMARREADLALRTARPTVGDLVVTRLLRVRWKLAASPSLACTARALKAWSDVRIVGCSAKLQETTPGRWYRQLSGELTPQVRADSLSVQLACARAGLGVALVPEGSIAPSGLRPIRLSQRLRSSLPPWPEDDFLLVTHRALREVPRVRAVWEFLVEHVGAAQS